LRNTFGYAYLTKKWRGKRMQNIIEYVRQELADNADEKTKESGKRFFKEEVQICGVKTATVLKISKRTFKQIKNRSKGEIFELCEQLWKSGIMEESFIACDWAYSLNEHFSENDFLIFEKWVNSYVSNWASCDTLCNHTIGTFIEMFPEFIERLKGWTKSQNRWVRRAAAVTLIIPAKKGLFKDHIFEIADKLLLDTDDLVQKGYGWMLKSLCENYEEDVYKYILNKRDIMPRTSLRYAIEKMPKEKKQEAMKKGKAIAL
jgi:3-methyladenine DNA glycosylase AlkD